MKSIPTQAERVLPITPQELVERASAAGFWVNEYRMLEKDGVAGGLTLTKRIYGSDDAQGLEDRVKATDLGFQLLGRVPQKRKSQIEWNSRTGEDEGVIYSRLRVGLRGVRTEFLEEVGPLAYEAELGVEVMERENLRAAKLRGKLNGQFDGKVAEEIGSDPVIEELRSEERGLQNQLRQVQRKLNQRETELRMEREEYRESYQEVAGTRGL